MKIRVACVGVLIVAMCMAASPLITVRASQADVCCGGPADCAVGKCCDPGALQLPDCGDEDRSGYCRAACIPGDGGR